MDKTKLDKWAELLLDTGKRNNLINFRDTKLSTVEVIVPDTAALFVKADSSTALEVYDPLLPEDDPDILDADAAEKSASAGTDRMAYKSQFAPRIRRQNQVLLYNANGTNPVTALHHIAKKAKEYLEETGVNVAYMAFGFVQWKESDAAHTYCYAPLLLVPVTLTRDSIVSPYVITPAGDEIVVNPTFAYKLEAEYGIVLPEYEDEGLPAYLVAVNRLVSPLGWAVVNSCKIGIFSFLKINMYRDLKDNAEKILHSANVRILLGEQPEQTGDGTETPEEAVQRTENPLVELHTVVDADSSQIEAIEMARTGKSFVLQGPPGTGKSQTITNIIAECLHDGKKVLFVSEKQAALNVIYEKLKQAGLSEFCLELHSHKAKKKEVIEDLCRTLRAEKTGVPKSVDAEIAAKVKSQRQLDSYAAELHTVRPGIDKSLYQLFEAYSAVREAPDIPWVIPEIMEKDETYLSEVTELLEQYVNYLPVIGSDYRSNPWYGYCGGSLSYQARTQTMADLRTVADCCAELEQMRKETSARYGMECRTVAEARRYAAFFHLAAEAEFLTPSLLMRRTLAVQADTLMELERRSREILTLKEKLDANYDEEIYQLNGAAYHKRLKKEFAGSMSHMFNQDYKKIMGDLRLCKRKGNKVSYPEAVAVTEQLANYQKRAAEFETQAGTVRYSFGKGYRGGRHRLDKGQ